MIAGHKDVSHRRRTVRLVLVTVANVQRASRHIPVDQPVNLPPPLTFQAADMQVILKSSLFQVPLHQHRVLLLRLAGNEQQLLQPFHLRDI